MHKVVGCARRRGSRLPFSRFWMVMLLATLVSACGGGGGASGGTDASPTAPSTPQPPSAPVPPLSAASAVTPTNASGQALISLSSDGDDWIGGGANYSYDSSNAAIRVGVNGTHLSIQVDGKESWRADFQLPRALGQLQTGTYNGLPRYALRTDEGGGLEWIGQGRACSVFNGNVVVEAVSYLAGVLTSIDLRFEQYCNSSNAALRGQIHIGPQAMARVAVPQNPMPEQPVVALKSDIADPIGGGLVYGYDSSNAVIKISAVGAKLSVSVNGDQQWSGEFQLPGEGEVLAVGSYAGLSRYPFQADAAGAMSWFGEGRGCNTIAASMVVNSVLYEAGVLKAVDMSFEQHCDGMPAALKGEIHWDSSKTTVPAGPATQMPAGLWTAPADAMPATGNAIYLFSEPGDYVGKGWTWLVGAAVGDSGGGGGGGGGGSSSGTAKVSISESKGLLQIALTGDVSWTGEFKAMNGVSHLQPGYYGILKRYPFHNPSRGGLDWNMDGHGCGALNGWFAVDAISYSGEQLESIDMRFTQYCDGSIAPLRGRIRWSQGKPIL